MIAMVQNFIATTPRIELIWLVVGLCAQMLFSARFLVQWIASERMRRSVIPEAFWYFSFAGGAMLLAYAIYRRDPVFIMGQSFGLVVYSRNIYFLWSASHQDKGTEPKSGA